MGILPIGFFSPLPLAMMIPFMATQSLAMGEAFGKSFQYGKRKISSLSNEEFNKLTFHDLMVEQTANIAAIVPELNKQMAQSKAMQSAIFAEMVNLIPTFFDSLFSALDPKHIENPSLITQASPPPAITNLRYTTNRDTTINQEGLDELKKQLDKLLEQAGTKDYTASQSEADQEKLKEELANINTRTLEEDKARELARLRAATIASDKDKQISAEWNIWSQNKTNLINNVLKTKEAARYWAVQAALIKQGRKAQPTLVVQKQILLTQQQLKIARAAILKLSQDYRNPNPMIQKGVIALRRQMEAIIR